MFHYDYKGKPNFLVVVEIILFLISRVNLLRSNPTLQYDGESFFALTFFHLKPNVLFALKMSVKVSRRKFSFYIFLLQSYAESYTYSISTLAYVYFSRHLYTVCRCFTDSFGRELTFFSAYGV